MALERIQLSIARAVLKLSRHDHSNISVLEAIGWPSLAWRRRRFKLLLLWDLLHGGGPPLLHEQVPPTVSSRSPYPLRNSLSISLPTCHSSRYSKSFLVSAISLYNSLPQSVSSCSSKHSFAQALNHHFASDKFSFGISWVFWVFFLSFFLFFVLSLSPPLSLSLSLSRFIFFLFFRPLSSRKALTLVSSYYLVILVKHITIIIKRESCTVISVPWHWVGVLRIIGVENSKLSVCTCTELPSWVPRHQCISSWTLDRGNSSLRAAKLWPSLPWTPQQTRSLSVENLSFLARQRHYIDSAGEESHRTLL